MSYTNLILTQPPKGEWFSAKEKVGHRIVIFGNSGIEEQPDNMNPGKMRNVATIDYVDLDDGQGGRIIWGAQCDKPGIVNKLKNQRNAIMGRLEYGEAKAGQSAPYILADHTAEDADYFTNVWMPANRAALAGNGAPAPRPQAQAPQAQAPQAQAPYSPPAPAPSAQPPLFDPAPAAQPLAAQAAPGLANGQAGAYTPEAMAAIERMIASGQIPGFPQPTH